MSSDHTGYLELYRLDNGVKRWCKRFFRLRGTKLAYGLSESELERYCIVSGVQVTLVDEHVFQIASVYPSSKKLHLRAATASEMRGWINAVQDVLVRERKTDQAVQSSFHKPPVGKPKGSVDRKGGGSGVIMSPGFAEAAADPAMRVSSLTRASRNSRQSKKSRHSKHSRGSRRSRSSKGSKGRKHSRHSRGSRASNSKHKHKAGRSRGSRGVNVRDLSGDSLVPVGNDALSRPPSRSASPTRGDSPHRSPRPEDDPADAEGPISPEDAARYTHTLQVLQELKYQRFLWTLVENDVDDSRLMTTSEDTFDLIGVPVAAAATIIHCLAERPNVFSDYVLGPGSVQRTLRSEMRHQRDERTPKASVHLPQLSASKSGVPGSAVLQSYIRRLSFPQASVHEVLDVMDSILALLYSKVWSERTAVAGYIDILLAAAERFRDDPAVMENCVRIMAVCSVNSPDNRQFMATQQAISYAVEVMAASIRDLDTLNWAGLFLALLSLDQPAVPLLKKTRADAVANAAIKAHDDDMMLVHNLSSMLDNLS